jgi:hypothetical protein
MVLLSAALASAVIAPTAPVETPVATVAPTRGTEAVPRVELQIGTAVPLILDETLSSQSNVKGDLVHLTLASDVIVAGRVIFPKGTKAVGELTLAERKSAMGVAGQLEAQLLYLECDHQIIRLSGRISVRGEDGTTAAVLTTVAVGSIAMVITGKSAIMRAGTPLTAYLDHDAWITIP